MEIAFLTIDDVLELHEEVIARYGGDLGLRDVGLLESALAVAQSGFGGQYFHQYPHEMAAAYLFHLAKNHGFVDGNKRVAWAAAILFLKINGVRYAIDQDEAVELTVGVAAGRIGKERASSFFEKHIKATG